MEAPFAETGNRIAEFGQSLCGNGHGWQSEFGRRMGMTPSAIASYLKGYQRPGAKVYDKLEALGADIYYIKTGHRKDEQPIDTSVRAAEIARRAREDALRDGIDDMAIIEDNIRFHIENARTQAQKDRLPYLQMMKSILATMHEQLDK